MSKRIKWPHPGEILEKEFMDEVGMTAYRLAKHLRIPQQRISEIIRGKRAISADTALRLARFIGTDAEFWLNLQADYDLRRAKRLMGDEISKIVPLETTRRKKLA